MSKNRVNLLVPFGCPLVAMMGDLLKGDISMALFLYPFWVRAGTI